MKWKYLTNTTICSRAAYSLSFSAAIIIFLAGCPYFEKPVVLQSDAATPNGLPDAFVPSDGEIDGGATCQQDSDCDDGNACTDNYCTEENFCESRQIVWQQVSSGGRHTCGLTEMGRVKCWGDNKHGQLGNDSRFAHFKPVDVSALNSETTMISVGLEHSCALTGSGEVKCWGDNTKGQLGNGTFVDSKVPVTVAGLEEDVSWISAGFFHTCAVTGSGDGYCWGDNRFGQLGDGTMNDSSFPVKTSGIAEELKSISAGYNHTCALTLSGGIKCWGLNLSGELGTGNQQPSFVPIDVEGLSSEATLVTTGLSHTCALTTGGGVKCWGSNARGELGDGEGGADQFSPVPKDVVGLTSEVEMVSAGYHYTCALTSGGGVVCWGSNTVGQLGDGTVNNWRSIPEDVPGLEVGVMNVSAGTGGPGEERNIHTCAVTAAGAIFCWGENIHGQAGDGTAGFSPAPTPVSGQSNETISMVSGKKHNCLLTETGVVKCWGQNSSGQLGNGSYESTSMPTGVTGLNGPTSIIATGNDFSCAVAAAGGVKCWGSNEYGQLGDSTTTSSNVAVSTSGLESSVISISAGMGDGGDPGGAHACAVDDNNSLWCWGLNNFGQLGDSTTENRDEPTEVLGLSESTAKVFAGYQHTCLLTVTGNVKCFGSNRFAQIGDGTTQDRHNPVSVQGLPGGVTDLALGPRHTCAVTTGGKVYCWGQSVFLTPTEVEGAPGNISELAAGKNHTCSLTGGGSVFCWGENEWGQAGSNRSVFIGAPAQVDGLTHQMTGISAGFQHSCAVSWSKTAWCWGSNLEGQLGIPINSSKPSPIKEHCSAE